MKKILLFVFVFLTLNTYAQDRYEGEKNKKGEPHGKGIMYWGDTLRFEGHFKKGLPYKEGKIYTYDKGNVYKSEAEGQIIAEKDEKGIIRVYADGYTKMKLNSGSSYEGYVKKNKAHGRGVYISGKTLAKYTGTFDMGKKTDDVIVTYPEDDWDVNSLNISLPPQSFVEEYENHTGFLPRLTEAEKLLKQFVENNETEKVLKLLDMGASPFAASIFIPIKNKNYTILEAMLKKQPLWAKYSQALHYACAVEDDNREMIDYLISKGAKLELNGQLSRWDDYTLAYVAAYSWNSGGYKFTPADVALNYGMLKNMEYLYEKYKVKPTKYGFSDLFVWAIRNRKDGVINNLLSQIPDFYPARYINQGSWDWDSPVYHYALTEAIKIKNKELVKKLLELGANPNNNSQSTIKGIGGLDYFSNPLYEAVRISGWKDIVNLLLEKGAIPYESILEKALGEYKEDFVLRGLLK